jgi:hypothetical protein
LKFVILLIIKESYLLEINEKQLLHGKNEGAAFSDIAFKVCGR